MIYVKPEFQSYFADCKSIEDFFAIEGPIARQTHNRKVMRFERDGESFYIKLHFGLGWQEIFKNWLSGRQPIYSARTEWRALNRLKEVGVASIEPVAYGVVGHNPANLRSFIITRDLGQLPDMREYTRDWPNKPPHPREKRLLIRQVAEMARRMHQAGINHRDFYICHFMMRELATQTAYKQFQLYLIDLHRAQCRERVPYRWWVKDIGSIYFSALDIGLTRRDFLRFLYLYSGKTHRQLGRAEQKFWRDVKKRAAQIYRRDFKREAQFPF